MSVSDRILPTGGIVPRRTGALRPGAEEYAFSLGLTPGGPGWGDAIRDYVLNGRPQFADAEPMPLLRSDRKDGTGNGPGRGGKRGAPERRVDPPARPLLRGERKEIRNFLGSRGQDVGKDASLEGRIRQSENRMRGILAPPPDVIDEPSFEDEWQAILAIEGGTNPDGSAKWSRNGAVGPAQIRVKFGRDYAKRAGLPWDENRAITDNEYNLALGRGYYAWLRHLFDAPTAAAAYNLGPYGMSWHLGRAVRAGLPDEWRNSPSLDPETRDYVRMFEDLVGLSPPDGRSAPKAKTATRKEPTRLIPDEADPWNFQSLAPE